MEERGVPPVRDRANSPPGVFLQEMEQRGNTLAPVFASKVKERGASMDALLIQLTYYLWKNSGFTRLFPPRKSGIDDKDNEGR